MIRRCSYPLKGWASRSFCTAVLDGNAKDGSVKKLTYQRVHSKQVQITQDDLADKTQCPLSGEGSPMVLTQLQILRHSIDRAANSLLSGDDIADHYAFLKMYQKYFHLPDTDVKTQNSTTLSCFIRLANEKKTKICLCWLPSNLTRSAIHKIITSLTDNDKYTSYIHCVNNSVRVLINSEASRADVPHYIELYNQDSEETDLLSVSIRNKRIRKK